MMLQFRGHRRKAYHSEEFDSLAIMQVSTLSLLCNPYAGEPLTQQGDKLVGAATGQSFPIRNGLPVILDATRLSRRTRAYRLFYELIAPAYDPVLYLSARWRVSTEQAIRENVIANVSIQPGDRVLDVATGTGLNLRFLPGGAEYFGVDISYRMLRRTQGNLERWGRAAELLQASGEYLPFRDNTFDHVIQVGGLQFYGDPFRGVREMGRVAKPGSRVLILDEASGARRTLRRLPAHAKYAANAAAAVAAMMRLVPQSMQSVQSEILPASEYYRLEFAKPSG